MARVRKATVLLRRTIVHTNSTKFYKLVSCGSKRFSIEITMATA